MRPGRKGTFEFDLAAFWWWCWLAPIMSRRSPIGFDFDLKEKKDSSHDFERFIMYFHLTRKL
jgi:hypothetical protein